MLLLIVFLNIILTILNVRPNQTKPNLLKAEGQMVTNTAKSNIKYTEIKTKQYKL